MSLTSPLGLMRHVRKPDLRMEVIPWLNLLLLGLMMYMLGSSYLWAPGLVVSNNLTGKLPAKLSLPTLPAPSGNLLLVGRADPTLVITEPQFILNGTTFEIFQPPQFVLPDGRHTEDTLPSALEKLRKSQPNAKPVLKIKASQYVPFGTMMRVWVMAQEAGFDSELLSYQSAAPGTTDATGNGKTP